MGWVVKTSPRACESVVLRARLSKCRLRRKSAPAGSPRSRRRACSPKACAPARGSRCAGFDSGRGRFAAPLFLNGFVVLSKDSSPLKRRSCYQGRTQHSGYSPEHYGFLISPCRPYTPHHKGKVESGVRYVKRNALAGREFKDIHEANAHLTLIAKSSKHENAKQPHWAQARSSCWGTRSPPL